VASKLPNARRSERFDIKESLMPSDIKSTRAYTNRLLMNARRLAAFQIVILTVVYFTSDAEHFHSILTLEGLGVGVFGAVLIARIVSFKRQTSSPPP
jgi:hypothetical protein